MYVPGPNAVDDPDVILELVRSAGFGHLVTADEDGVPAATSLPFLIDDQMLSVRAHVARANPHWRTIDGRPALLFVPISDAYVSPAWYPSKAEHHRVVPTWNYELVHLHGTVAIRDDAVFVEAVVRDLTDRHEESRTREVVSPPRWSVDDAPRDFVDRQLGAVVGIELTVDRVEAKRKLSQNRDEADRQGVFTGLSTSPDRRDRAVAAAMKP